MKILNIVGARPNFMKIAPLMAAMARHGSITPRLVHTGQHYDAGMAGRFFEDLSIPPPDVSLEVGSGTHAWQTAEIMKKLEPILVGERPDVLLVVGDVNSTIAAALTAVKLGIPVAHVEAGLRSFDRTMPEEINRILTDAISEFLFVTEESGVTNLVREGVPREKIHLVGNVMIDSLETSRKAWSRSRILGTLGLAPGGYGVVTLHRPSNVDDPAVLRGLIGALAESSRDIPFVFPVHPRTRKALETAPEARGVLRFGEGPAGGSGILALDPVGYIDFMALVAGARIVLTDSGGLQEETTVLGIPCLTLRENTERPITVSHGTNRVIGSSPARIVSEVAEILSSPPPAASAPPLWDGKASERIVSLLWDRLGRGIGSRTTAARTA